MEDISARQWLFSRFCEDFDTPDELFAEAETASKAADRRVAEPSYRVRKGRRAQGPPPLTGGAYGGASRVAQEH